MTATILLIQIALPLALVARLAFQPSGSATGLVLQVAGIGGFLFALGRVAQWAVPVWSLPSVYGGIWLAAACVALSLRPGLVSLPIWPSGGWG